MERATTCTELTLKGLPVEEVIVLAAALAHHTSLKSLIVTESEISGEAAEALAKVLAETLRGNSSVQLLNFYGDHMDDITLLAEAF